MGESGGEGWRGGGGEGRRGEERRGEVVKLDKWVFLVGWSGVGAFKALGRGGECRIPSLIFWGGGEGVDDGGAVESWMLFSCHLNKKMQVRRYGNRFLSRS